MNRWLIGFTKLIATFFIIFTYSPSFSQSGDELMANVNVNAFEAAIVEACEMFNGVQQDKARKVCGNKVMREFLRNKSKFNSCGKHEYFGQSEALFKCIYNIDKNNISPNKSSSQQSQPTQQQAQQQAQQSQQLATQNQARADQARQGKRKTHDPAAEAHQCIDVDVDSPIVGGFKNKCSYAVSYGYCVFNPKKGGWTDSPIFNCNSMIGKTTAGGQDIKPNGYDVNHTRGGEFVYFFACRQPKTAMDLTFIPGQGIQGRCGNLMGD